MKQYIFPPDAKPTGAYSPAVSVGNLIFISGQGTLDVATGEKYLGNISRQADLAMQNLKKIIEHMKLSMQDIVKTTIFLTNMKDSSEVNRVYQTYFKKDQYPARSTVAVKELPGGMNVEIEAIAYRKE